LLRKLIGPLIGSATFAVIQKYQTFFENHFSAYLFFTSTGLDIEHLITFLLIGFIVAYVAREREILATACSRSYLDLWLSPAPHIWRSWATTYFNGD